MEISLRNPTCAELMEEVNRRLSEGLWKVGQCFEDLLDKRPRSAAQYNEAYFNRAGARVAVVAHGVNVLRVDAGAQCVFCALDGGRLELRGFRRVQQANTKDDGASAVEVSFIVLGTLERRRVVK